MSVSPLPSPLSWRRRREPSLLLTAQGLSGIGDRFQDIALPLWILAVTGSPVRMGLTFSMSVLPVVLLAPWAGWLADRYDRRRLLIAAECGSSLLMLGLVLAVRHSSFVGVCLALLALRVTNCVALPAAQAILKGAAEHKEQGRWAATSGVLSGGTATLGPVAGALLYEQAGILPVLFINLASFAAGAACAAFLLPHPGDRNLAGPVQASLAVARRILGNQRLWPVGAAEAVYFLLAGALGVVGLIVVQDHLGPGAAGLFGSGQGLGWLVASVLVRRYSGRATVAVALAAVALGPLSVLMALGLTSNGLVVAVLGVLDGAVNAAAAIGALVLYQTEALPADMGRVFALRRLVVNGGLSIACTGWPLLASGIGTTPTLLVSGWCASSLMLLALLPRALSARRAAAGAIEPATELEPEPEFESVAAAPVSVAASTGGPGEGGS
jgi:hypothetical protein